MEKEDIEFQKRIRATFKIEAEDHIQAISSGLIELEKKESELDVSEIIEAMFREFHSLKGAARSVDQKDIEYLCQPIENIFSLLKRKEIKLSDFSFEILYKTVELISKHISNLTTDQPVVFRAAQQDLIRQLKEVSSGNFSVSLPSSSTLSDSEQSFVSKSFMIKENVEDDIISAKNLHAQTEMVRIPLSKLDPLLLQAEEMVQSKIAFKHRTDELKELCEYIYSWKNEEHKLKSRRILNSMDFWNEWIDTTDVHLNLVNNRLDEITHSIEHDQHYFERLVDDHLETMKQVLMLPISSVVETFPGMVREISREQNKEINFIIKGTELEIDKRILEELKDPLIHLIRNSISHGISKPQERILQNKSPRGTISLEFAVRESGQVEITLSDDGNGIDREHILKIAIKSGILSKEDASNLKPEEVLNLIYHSGVSTSSIITDISGHGLGLSIVHEKVVKLNGKISVESEINQGTTFRIITPMTLAAFRGIMVKLKDFIFILPTMNVERALKVSEEVIKTIENHETLTIEGRIIPIVDLVHVLGLPERKNPTITKIEQGTAFINNVCIVVLVLEENRIAFKVDDLVEEQQILVKGLGKLMIRVRNISGATILGSGKVVPVLNVPDLMKTALKMNGQKGMTSVEEIFIPQTSNILVAEDSITSRTLIKNILEAAGYKVTTSIDGADAFSKARIGDFDLIVSDVDMPKMNGFELTAKIRNDKKLNEIPVVLVTALESREDRERGIEVGADAYIIKSSFDQTNLLEVIKKLI